MKVDYYLTKIKSLPPHIVFKKVFQKLFRKINDSIQKQLDLNTSTWTKKDINEIKNSFININSLDISNLDKQVAEYHIKMYLSHRFDLLGSGWIKNSYDSMPLGLEGYKYNMNIEFKLENILRKAHLDRAKNIYKLIDKDYKPIDWQKDYKSGYRWSQKTWYKDTRKIIGNFLGVDIKIPWELSRMQHLPQLAIFSLICSEYKEKCIREFKNQVLDFIATNPPKMGVNWACTMDVAIRAANMLIAYDLFNQLDEKDILNKNFKKYFAASIYEHGEFITNNLEWSEVLTSNHYLANICGLLFIGAYLDREDWISFSYQEILKETKKQFYADGGNFESSTSYHRLSGEMLIYSVALILRLLKSNKIREIEYKISDQKLKIKKVYKDKYVKNLPNWFIDRVYKIGRFTVDITKPNNEIPQVGDNDSGRFIKLTPVGKFLSNDEAEKIYLNLKGYKNLIKNYGFEEKIYWDENILNHKTFISAVSGLFENKIFKTDIFLEKSFVETLASFQKLYPKNKGYVVPKVNLQLREIIKNLKFEKIKKYKLPFIFEDANIEKYFYPMFGLYIFKNKNFYLSICVTPLGQNDNGGHTHNDKLSYELWIDGRDIELDPGTYVYTPLPHRRNEFRSSKAHNVPIPKKLDFEQNKWIEGKNGIFMMIKSSDTFLFELEKNYISFILETKDIIFYRKFLFEGNYLFIIDKSNVDFEYSNFKWYSNGYGKIKKR